MAKALGMVTRCTGFSYSVGEPISKEPAGITTSSAQSEQSRNTSPALKSPRPGSTTVAGAVDEACGAGAAGGAGLAAGGGAGAGAGVGGGVAAGAVATGREVPK